MLCTNLMFARVDLREATFADFAADDELADGIIARFRSPRGRSRWDAVRHGFLWVLGVTGSVGSMQPVGLQEHGGWNGDSE